MNIRIYQVNMNRDTNNVAFMGYELLEKLQGSQTVDSKIYDKVFDGEVNCQTLEGVYQMFNLNHPEGYKDRSLSVSDVVEILEDDTHFHGFYFCDSVGFKSIDFEPKDCLLGRTFTDTEKKNMISVLLVEPNKYPKMIEIEDSLEAMQKIVGGDIEEYMPFEDDVAIICNEEGKLIGLQPNRAVYADEEKKEMTEIICGKFFMVYAPVSSEKFLSLPPELSEKYREKFKYPERFARINDKIIAVPFKPKSKEAER